MPAKSQYDYDLITIGAGSGGVRASRRAAALGRKVAVIENLRVGGTCVMRGCVPKKLLVLGSHFGEDFEDAEGYGWTVGDTSFDWKSLITAKEKELDRLEKVYHKILEDNGVEEITGTGVLADAHTVEVDGKSYTAGNILIATGGWPKLPDVPGIEHAITSNEALDLVEFPSRIVIVGGGYIAVEFAGIFNSFGADVTIVIRKPQILRGFDEGVRGVLSDEMEKKGITIRRECTVESIEKTVGKGVGKNGGGFSVSFSDGGVIEVDQVMYATGRGPNTKGIGLEDAGIGLDVKGAVEVDEFSRTTVPNIYAIGDVTERMNLTPVAIAEAEALVKTLYGEAPAALDYANVPTAVFSQPPVGTVGLTEDEARERGDIDVYVSRFTPMKHTLSGRDEKTWMKLIVDRKTDIVLGCHMVGLDAPEIAQGLGIALKCGATKAQFDATIGIHPTAAEEFVTMRDKRPDPGGD